MIWRLLYTLLGSLLFEGWKRKDEGRLWALIGDGYIWLAGKKWWSETIRDYQRENLWPPPEEVMR